DRWHPGNHLRHRRRRGVTSERITDRPTQRPDRIRSCGLAHLLRLCNAVLFYAGRREARNGWLEMAGLSVLVYARVSVLWFMVGVSYSQSLSCLTAFGRQTSITNEPFHPERGRSRLGLRRKHSRHLHRQGEPATACAGGA